MAREMTISEFRDRLKEPKGKLCFLPKAEHRLLGRTVYVIAHANVSWHPYEYSRLFSLYHVYSNYWDAHAQLCKILKADSDEGTNIRTI